MAGDAIESDAELLLRARKDPDAFRVVYDRYAGRMHAFLLRRTGDREAALELTAETFAQAWIGRHRFRDLAGGTAGPWLFAIARRTLVRSVSRRRLERSALERLQVSLAADAVEVTPIEAWLDGLDTDVASALAALPPDQRQAVELRVVGDLPYGRIAERLGCSSVAVRIRVSRGLATLRSRLEGTQ